MSIILRLAWRNLWRHKRRTWLTVSAMVFSNVLLVFMISLQLGTYKMMIDNTLNAFSGHIQVQHHLYNDDPKIRYSIPEIIQLTGQLQHALGSDAVSARASAFALASSEQRSYGIQIIGVQPQSEFKVSTIPGLVKEGRYLSDPYAEEIVIGKVLARNLKVKVGDELTLLGSGRDGSFAAGIVKIAGIYESGLTDLDRGMVEMPLLYFQQLFVMENQGHAIVVNVPDLFEVNQWQQKIIQQIKVQPELLALNWMELQPGLLQAIQADMSSAWFMYGILIILVAFSVLNTQLMSVLERTREFGITMALGLKPGKLARLIILETGLMASLGLLLGCLIGFLITLYYQRYGFYYPGMEEMAIKFNLPDRMYPSASWLSVLFGPLIVYLFSMLATLYPALRLYFLRPVDAMRAA
ncbi:MAG: ABC transporter permease [Gammaproteobacteria bacterium]|nr:ABC transporter permease [Gammaproteobacteria bacterium]